MSAPPRPDVDDDDPAVSDRRSSGTRRRKRRSWARRKHLGLLTIGAVLLILVAGVLAVVATWDRGRVPLSQQTAAAVAAGSTSTPPSTTAPSATTSVSSAPGSITVRGTITATGDSRLTVAADTGITYAVVVTPSTTLPRQRPFSEFGVGQKVTIRGTLDSGTVTAVSLQGGTR
ncbi:hypothetical protein ACXR2U_21020 [Jatrophihabitans sp. YIM 134969]